MATGKQQPALYLSKVQRRYPEGENWLEVLRGAGETAWIFGEVIDAAEVAFEERVQFG